MITETGTVALEDVHSAVSWKAILAGTVAAGAITLLMVAFGVGVGFSVVSPWADEGISATTFTLAAGVYLIVIAMIPSTIGGYLAGRLRSRWQTVHHHERYFRDSAHGFLVWALATVVIAAFLGGAMSHLLSAAGAGASTAAGVAAKAAPTDIYVDRLLRTGAPQGAAAAAVSTPANQTSAPGAGASSAASQPPTAPQATSTASEGNRRVNRTEISRILAPALLKGGNVSDSDKTYLAQVVAARSGMSQAQAQERVNQTIVQAKTDAGAARKSAAKFALWLVASMLAGALAASLAAIEGGSLRNSEWYLTAR